MSSPYQRELGARLRSIRNQQGLTLQEVQERSGGTWKAVVVGSYERGDRAISVPKLAQLAEFYGVPLAELLPEGPDRTPALEPAPKLILDLGALEEEDGGAVAALARFARRIQIQRGDFNGRVLSLRRGDVNAVAIAAGVEPEELIGELVARDALIES